MALILSFTKKGMLHKTPIKQSVVEALERVQDLNFTYNHDFILFTDTKGRPLAVNRHSIHFIKEDEKTERP